MGSATDRIWTGLLTAAMLLAGSGCTLIGSSVGAGHWWRRDEPQVATQMVPVWSDTVLHQAGEPATRGIGGRVMFYGLERHRTIRTTGVLVVYVWDDSLGTSQRSPDRKYVFPAGNLEQHYSPSRMGHSYSFWLPWDEAGGTITHLTVVTRFVGTEGTELTSSPAHVVLPGPGDGSQFYKSLAQRRSPQEPVSEMGQSIPQVSVVNQAAFSDAAPMDESTVIQTAGQQQAAEITAIALPRGFLNRNLRGIGGPESGPPVGSTELQQAVGLRGVSAAAEGKVGSGDGGMVPEEGAFVQEPLRTSPSADSELDLHLAPAAAAAPLSGDPFHSERYRRPMPVGSRRTPATKSLVPQPRRQQRWPIPDEQRIPE